MVDLKFTTMTGAETIVEEAAVEELKSSLRGELILPSDADYEEARTIFNAMIDKRPSLIVRCAGVADVISCVNFARANSLLVAVRGAGHNVAGTAVCDGGIVIDLSQMKGVRTDLAARTVRAEPGLTWAELNHDLQPFGLAATGGFISTTGIGGLTLGGGLGWLVRKHGLACDNLLSVDIVTADGKFLTASATENEDLFWGVRGGGGNLGVVTSFEFRVHPVGTVLSGMVVHPIARAKEVLQFWREFEATAPVELTTGAGLLMAPSAPFVPEEAWGTPVIGVFGVYTGDLDAGEQAIRPLREFGPPVVDLFQPTPYNIAQAMLDDFMPTGYHNYWKSSFLTDLTDDAIDTMIAQFAKVPSPMTVVIIEHNGGGAMNRVGASETAFGHRDMSYNFLIPSLWADPADSEKNVTWTREFWEAMQPFARDAVYVNYLDQEGDERVKAAYAAPTYDRLVTLKNKYDPTNLFRLNQNIKPTVEV
ncbi:MAG: FAD-binding oxidoreductase [Chloroflexi bacterium]|nr:FAD-binding oxidoreductase [Chloroflexota bacterium]